MNMWTIVPGDNMWIGFGTLVRVGTSLLWHIIFTIYGYQPRAVKINLKSQSL